MPFPPRPRYRRGTLLHNLRSIPRFPEIREKPHGNKNEQRKKVGTGNGNEKTLGKKDRSEKEFHKKVQSAGLRQRRARGESDEARQLKIRPQREENNQSQAGHRHRTVGGAPVRGKGSICAYEARE